MNRYYTPRQVGAILAISDDAVLDLIERVSSLPPGARRRTRGFRFPRSIGGATVIGLVAAPFGGSPDTSSLAPARRYRRRPASSTASAPPLKLEQDRTTKPPVGA
jgi:hypothetical protein